nr:substrate-binding domain-containing protein [Leucobacter manosquensis]
MGFAGLDIDIWNDILALMEEEAAEAGYELLSSDPQWDVQKQVSDWEAWVQRGDVKAIMGFPVQSDAMVPVTTRAVEAGVPVLAYGTLWDGALEGTMFDPYEDGYMVGTAAAKWINENKAEESTVPVALIADKTSDLGNGRVQGIQDALRELAPQAKVQELPGISREDGNSAAKSHLIAVPETSVWIGNNNDNALGAYQSLLDSGVAKDDGNYWIGAPDATNETLDVISIPNSIWRGGFILPAAPIAESNVKLLIAAAEGREVVANTVPLTPVDASNANEFYVD